MLLGVKACSQKALEYGVELSLLIADVNKALGSLSHEHIARSLLERGMPGLVITALLREVRGAELAVQVPGLPRSRKG
eukprot:12724246-Alexandrium_andersonii.AAC.1